MHQKNCRRWRGDKRQSRFPVRREVGGAVQGGRATGRDGGAQGQAGRRPLGPVKRARRVAGTGVGPTRWELRVFNAKKKYESACLDYMMMQRKASTSVFVFCNVSGKAICHERIAISHSERMT